MFIVGLTGGIGSGKSAVAQLFAGLGVPIIDADIIAREVVAPGQPALKEIINVFGTDVLTASQELDRSKLRAIIFNDVARRKQLESILHPRIRKEMRHRAKKSSAPYCIFVIPLLVETGQHTTVDRVLVVDANERIRRQRLKNRDHMNDEEIDKAFSAQATSQQRLAVADDVLNNNNDLASLREQVIKLDQQYTLLAARQ